MDGFALVVGCEMFFGTVCFLEVSLTKSICFYS